MVCTGQVSSDTFTVLPYILQGIFYQANITCMIYRYVSGKQVFLEAFFIFFLIT